MDVNCLRPDLVTENLRDPSHLKTHILFLLPVSDQHGVGGRSGQTGGPLPTDGRLRGLSGLQPRGVDGPEGVSGGVHVQRRPPVVQTGGLAGGVRAEREP